MPDKKYFERRKLNHIAKNVNYYGVLPSIECIDRFQKEENYEYCSIILRGIKLHAKRKKIKLPTISKDLRQQDLDLIKELAHIRSMPTTPEQVRQEGINGLIAILEGRIY